MQTEALDRTPPHVVWAIYPKAAFVLADILDLVFRQKTFLAQSNSFLSLSYNVGCLSRLVVFFLSKL